MLSSGQSCTRLTHKHLGTPQQQPALRNVTFCFTPTLAHSSSLLVSWLSLRRSGCSTTTTHRGPPSWATALACHRSSACLLTWSTTCLMLRAHSSRYKHILSFPPLSLLYSHSLLFCSLTDASPTATTAFGSFLFSWPRQSTLSCEHMTGDQDQRRTGGDTGQRLERKNSICVGLRTQADVHILLSVCRRSLGDKG